MLKLTMASVLFAATASAAGSTAVQLEYSLNGFNARGGISSDTLFWELGQRFNVVSTPYETTYVADGWRYINHFVSDEYDVRGVSQDRLFIGAAGDGTPGSITSLHVTGTIGFAGTETSRIYDPTIGLYTQTEGRYERSIPKASLGLNETISSVTPLALDSYPWYQITYWTTMELAPGLNSFEYVITETDPEGLTSSTTFLISGPLYDERVERLTASRFVWEEIQPVPEPSTYAMFLLGGAFLTGARYLKRRAGTNIADDSK